MDKLNTDSFPLSWNAFVTWFATVVASKGYTFKEFENEDFLIQSHFLESFCKSLNILIVNEMNNYLAVIPLLDKTVEANNLLDFYNKLFIEINNLCLITEL